MKPLTDPSASEQRPRDDVQGRHRIAWWLARNALIGAIGLGAASLVEWAVLQDIVPLGLARKIFEVRSALAKLSAYYCQAGYQQNVDDYVASEERKANEWLLSSSLRQQKPLLGWRTRRLSTTCRSPR
jgi:hypothetical protein